MNDRKYFHVCLGFALGVVATIVAFFVLAMLNVI